MKKLKLAVGALNQTPLDWQNNLNNILDCISQAKSNDVAILCLPELAITGYGCEDAFYAPFVQLQSLEILEEIRSETQNIAVLVGLPLEVHNKVYNAAALLVNRQIAGFYLKQHLPNYTVFYEDRWFHRWPAHQTDEIEINGLKYPVGDITFEVDGIHLGIEICEDAWVPQRPAVHHFKKGVDLILNPSASPFEFFKFQTRERLVQESSRNFSCTYLYTNLLGNESGRLIFDGDAMVAQNGKLLASSERFSYANFTLTMAEVDLSNSSFKQTKVKSFAPPKNTIKLSQELPSLQKVAEIYAKLEAFESGGFLKEEEFARAISLGLFDYLRKSKSQGFTISLSGGADSSACAALCRLMISLAEESVGLDAFKSKLKHIQKIQNCPDADSIAKELIHGMYQQSTNSSKETESAAKNLAKSIGATFYQISIEQLVNTYTQLVQEQFGKELNWKEHDISLQNIQARVRAPSIWMMTNLTNHLLLATSNRSEVAVGYCTMDGDTAGSISPISGIDKTWLRHWLIWLEKTGCNVHNKQIRIEGLKYVNSLQPTAELRPKEQNQTDEKDLMPYEILNRLEYWAIEKWKSPRECLDQLELEFGASYTKENRKTFVERFFKLFSRNQWKRERYAPGFHVDSRNLDSRSWLRFPILNGGYSKELVDLQEEKESTRRKKIGF